MRIAASLVMLAACGGSPAAPDAEVGPDAHLTCARWTAATINIVPGASTAAKEASPTIAGDHGLIAFAASPTATSELYTVDYFAGARQATRIDALDDGTPQTSPRWNSDGTRLYWSRSGVLVSATYRDGAFGAATAELGLDGETVATLGLSTSETELFYGDNADPTLSQLHYATRPAIGAAWTAKGALAVLNMGGDSAPTLTHDQFTLYWESHRGGHGKLYTAVRQHIGDPWAQVEIFDQLAGADGDPDDSSHDTVFAYTANDDIYVAT
ncbi:MAG TPA: hypothetical protein VFQ65_11780, partial [Kofleriaceae bacterium]|nr:hypothetical protein [Kofleriaceae bacterium]